ncbi:unnamed protein product, partial [Mesorhabditis belari]|uniref:DRBM domain-containing protein n=1 Tax=Mesorhabditis belari TaxID=2138241 RepID=A0AAF3FPT0_9BILA
MSLYDFFTPVSQLYDEEPEYLRPQYSASPNSATNARYANFIYFTRKEFRERIGAENIVGFLDEATMRQYKETTRYEVLEQTGTAHNPIFTIRCGAVGYREEGVGPNKRVAKINAVREVLKKIVENDDHEKFLIPGETKEERMNFIENLTDKSLVMSSAQITINENYVGALQELCMKNKVNVPVYDFEEFDADKEKIFKVTCKIKGFDYCAQDRTKKKAKNEAARQMLETLKETIKEMENDLHIDGSDDQENGEPLEDQQAKDESACENLEQLLEELKASWIVSHEYKNPNATSSKDSKTVLLKISIKKNEREMGRSFAFSGFMKLRNEPR